MVYDHVRILKLDKKFKLAFVFFCALFLIFLNSKAVQAALSADDFIPPVQVDNPTQRKELLEIKDEASIKTETDTVLNAEVTTASSLQDAINKVLEKPKRGCRILMEPNGEYAFVATGQGTYKADHQNVNASRIEQRNAYVVAFMEAKAEMAQTVGEIVFRGATNFEKKIETLDNETKSLTNLESELSEEQIQTVRKVLKGYVTYSVQDNGKGAVYVNIVSSSKTRGKYNRNGTDGLVADNLRDGLNSLIIEIRNGFVPPVGGRIIEVPSTGEVAFVGFGSSVVRYDAEEDVQEELKLSAERVAGLRATDALAGIILGDDTSWQAHADETTVQSKKDFEYLQQSDQASRGTETEIKAYDERKRSLWNSLRNDTKIQSLRKGILPPGIMRETSLDENEYFAYGIAVYVPSLTNAVREVSKEMDETELVQTPKENTSSTSGTTEQNKQKLEIKKGPSGVVQQNL
jgi:hypothetical protein